MTAGGTETAPGPAIEGHVAPGFEAVAQAFRSNFVERADPGAAFAVWRGDECLVDLRGGIADEGRPWRADTLMPVFSGTKGLVAACALVLVDRGLLSLDRPVADYWPEFAAAGKERVLVRHVLSHRSGLPGIARPVGHDDIRDCVAMENALAAQPLWADPDAFACYHPLTIGWLVGGLVRRIDGRSVGRFFREVIAGPLNLDAWIGLPAEHLHRTGRVRCAEDFVALGSGTEPAEASPLATAIWANPPLFPDDRIPWNDPDHMTAEIPGAGGIADARSMARFYACLVGGETRGRSAILSPATLPLANAELSRFTDPFTGDPMAFGAMFAVQTARRRFGPPADAFGHGGAGQSLHGAWPGKGIGFSYVMRELRSDPEATRSRVLLDALWSALGRGGP